MVLPADLWQRLDDLAARVKTTAGRGATAGQPSWRVLLRQLAERPEVLDLVAQTMTSQRPERAAGRFLPEMVIIRPPQPRTATIARIYTSGATVVVEFPEKREDFRDLIKSLDYEWGGAAWQRPLNVAQHGAPADRAAELGHRLLAAGFCVAVAGREIQAKAIAGDYEPEARRRVVVRARGDYGGWPACSTPSASWTGKSCAMNERRPAAKTV